MFKDKQKNIDTYFIQCHFHSNITIDLRMKYNDGGSKYIKLLVLVKWNYNKKNEERKE